MEVVAQLVRASVCGSEGRGFETHHPPNMSLFGFSTGIFFCYFHAEFKFVFHHYSNLE